MIIKNWSSEKSVLNTNNKIYSGGHEWMKEYIFNDFDINYIVFTA